MTDALIMEGLRIILDDGTGKEFDKRLEEFWVSGVQECGDLQLVTKTDGTMTGNPVVMITFTTRQPDGTLQKVQAVTSVKLLVTAAEAIKARHPLAG